jgi:hypothetical protein
MSAYPGRICWAAGAARRRAPDARRATGAEQESSYGETVSTLAFGARVSDISLGAARKHCESGALFEAREAAGRQARRPHEASCPRQPQQR